MVFLDTSDADLGARYVFLLERQDGNALHPQPGLAAVGFSSSRFMLISALQQNGEVTKQLTAAEKVDVRQRVDAALMRGLAVAVTESPFGEIAFDNDKGKSVFGASLLGASQMVVGVEQTAVIFERWYHRPLRQVFDAL